MNDQLHIYQYPSSFIQYIQTSGMCQTLAQMTMIVTQHLHHVGTYGQFWTEQQMVLTSMLHLLL